jgi:phosphoribosylanthranilate isomerase
MLIHATAITNLTDARYFAAREVSHLGFHMETASTDYLDPIWMKAIQEWVQGPALTGWFFDSKLEEVKATAEFYKLDAVVISLSMLTDTKALSGLVFHVYVANPSDLDLSQLDSLTIQPASIILDLRGAEPSLSDKVRPISAESLSNICRRRPTLFYTDQLAADTVTQWLAYEPAGFCVSGGAEERVGVKHFDELEDFFDWLEVQA